MTKDGEPAVGWQHYVEMDGDELRADRDRMKIRLARYAHVPMSYWDDKDVAELKYWFEKLRELLDLENEVQHVTET
jgi:hypothetical protein